MLGAVHEYRLLILEKHLDSYGHVNNAAFLEILEEARWDLITRNGYGLEEIHRLKVGPVVLDVHMRFVKELRNRQEITIRSWVDAHWSRVRRFAQQIVSGGEVCCEAQFTIGLFDLTARRLIRRFVATVRARDAALRPAELTLRDPMSTENRPSTTLRTSSALRERGRGGSMS